jgi:putative ABC transport system permease protein
MHFIPILSTLRRHRAAAALIVLEIAFTCAIVCNAVFLIRERLARMDRPSGVAESELVRVQLTGIGTGTDARAATAQDLAALRSIPGVKSAANVNMVPFGNSSWNTDISNKPDDSNRPVNVAMYMGSEDLVETLGVRLIAGRDFNPDEYVDFDDVQALKADIPSVIVTRAVAEKLYPGQSALGKPLYVWGKEPQTVVGIIERIARPNEAGGTKSGREYAMILPVTMPYTYGGNYLMRVDSSRRSEVLAAADASLDRVDPNRIILNRQTFDQIRFKYFRQDRSMAYLLAGVSIALLIITALGVVGLASFWVQQRTRQIGIRRALGATRGDILRYFQTENFILATMGIILGMGLAYGINLWLMSKYHVPRLPAEFLPIGASLLWLLGQVAVLGPALRASLIPPAIATRTV